MRVDIIKEYNNFYVLPTIRLFWDGEIGSVYLVCVEFVWFTRALSLTIYDKQ